MKHIIHMSHRIKKLPEAFFILASTWVIAPGLVHAQGRNTFQGLVGRIYDFLASLVPIIISLTLVVFLWGIFKLVQSNSEDARKDAIKVITFGIIALFVMVSVWGFVAILSNTFFGGQVLLIPQLR